MKPLVIALRGFVLDLKASGRVELRSIKEARSQTTRVLKARLLSSDSQKMCVREAKADDNHQLQRLQAQCPMGTNLVVAAVNTPDFFARARTCESCKVFVACEGDRIIGSAACTIREALTGGDVVRVGYEFRAFAAPDHRRKG